MSVRIHDIQLWDISIIVGVITEGVFHFLVEFKYLKRYLRFLLAWFRAPVLFFYSLSLCVREESEVDLQRFFISSSNILGKLCSV